MDAGAGLLRLSLAARRRTLQQVLQAVLTLDGSANESSGGCTDRQVWQFLRATSRSGAESAPALDATRWALGAGRDAGLLDEARGCGRFRLLVGVAPSGRPLSVVSAPAHPVTPTPVVPSARRPRRARQPPSPPPPSPSLPPPTAPATAPEKCGDSGESGGGGPRKRRGRPRRSRGRSQKGRGRKRVHDSPSSVSSASTHSGVGEQLEDELWARARQSCLKAAAATVAAAAAAKRRREEAGVGEGAVQGMLMVGCPSANRPSRQPSQEQTPPQPPTNPPQPSQPSQTPALQPTEQTPASAQNQSPSEPPPPPPPAPPRAPPAPPLVPPAALTPVSLSSAGSRSSAESYWQPSYADLFAPAVRATNLEPTFDVWPPRLVPTQDCPLSLGRSSHSTASATPDAAPDEDPPPRRRRPPERIKVPEPHDAL